MNRANILYNYLNESIPFCFVKINDGEMVALNKSSTEGISRGDERSSTLMSIKIKECLEFHHKDYFVGIPCKKCYIEHYNKALNEYIIPVNDKFNGQKVQNILNANILINSNINNTIEILKKTMKGKRIVIVSNKTNLLNIRKLKKLNIVPYKTIEVAEKFAFENSYELVKNEWISFEDDDIIICLCGPLGRILCKEWFQNNNNLTCLELGSLFDPLLKNRSYLYHTGNHQYCEECFPDNRSDDCDLIKLCDGPINKECYYFDDLNYYCHFYNHNWDKIKKNTQIRLEKEPGNTFLKDVLELCEDNMGLTVSIPIIENHIGGNIFKLYSKPLRKNDKSFYVVYHIATINEKWRYLTQNTYEKIKKSGMLEDNNLKGIKISYLGNPEFIQELKQIWNHDKIEIINNGADVELFEFPAIKMIRDICKEEDCNILYLHCKGLMHENDAIKDWIDLLEYFNIEKYKYCLDKLIDYDAVGCNFYQKHGDPYYVNHPFDFALFILHYSGNYWWSKSSYINTLDNIDEPSTGRWACEFWICNEYKNGGRKNFWSFYTSRIDFGNKTRTNFLLRDTYEGLEKLDFNFVRTNYIMDDLCKKYAIDNFSPFLKHNYTYVYSDIFNGKNIKKLLEIGVGYIQNNNNNNRALNDGYKTGNSLRMWKDLIPYANIYGIDIYDISSEVNEEGITTFVCDRSNKEQLHDLMKKIDSKLDVIIDNGSHIIEHQITSFINLENYLSVQGTYVIEDIMDKNVINWKDLSFFTEEYKVYLRNKYNIHYFRQNVNNNDYSNMVVFSKKYNKVNDFNQINNSFNGIIMKNYSINNNNNNNSNNNNENIMNKVDYRNNTKSQLYNLASQFYNSGNMNELNNVCELYLEYFEHLDDEQVRKMLFWSGFANFGTNRELAIKQFEKIYDNPLTTSDDKFFTKCNMEMLYEKNRNPIPKIIHLLCFGKMEFMKFHFACVKSMINHMPNYKIIIYTDEAPIGNKYWDELTNKNEWTVHYINPPEYFDGLKLQYNQYKADVVRMELLYEKGGIYLDLDLVIIKNFENIINSGKDLYISEEGVRGGGLINSFIACKPKNEFIKIWLDTFKTGLRMESWAYHIRESNKQLLTKNPHYIIKYNIEILESKYFFPFKWEEREKFINIEDYLNADIHGIHLFETILKDVLIDNKFLNKIAHNNLNNMLNNNIINNCETNEIYL